MVKRLFHILLAIGVLGIGSSILAFSDTDNIYYARFFHIVISFALAVFLHIIYSLLHIIYNLGVLISVDFRAILITIILRNCSTYKLIDELLFNPTILNAADFIVLFVAAVNAFLTYYDWSLKRLMTWMRTSTYNLYHKIKSYK